MTLDAAHRGYDYQDLLTAIRFVDMLLGRVEVTHVDEKLFDGDVLDDLTSIDLERRRERVQFKHSDQPKELPLSIFTSKERDLKLDALLSAVTRDREGPGAGDVITQYRLVFRDHAPDSELAPFIRIAAPDPGGFDPAFQTSRYRLDLEASWPSSPSTTRLSRTQDPFRFLREGGARRDDFVWLCSHLVIELGAPAASFDLTRPGPAEHVLLQRLGLEVGAGLYPNEDRNAVDVAQSLISMARAAREKRCQASRGEALLRSRLRSDFGAVARAHPVDAAREVERRSAVTELVALAETAADQKRPVLLLGSPGQGKSWICHQAVTKFVDAGWLVAEHYCFLGDTDTDRSGRVATERIIGSLLNLIAEVDPVVVQEQRPRYAADERALVGAVSRSLSSSPERRVALIIDGLDHVTRVQGAIVGRQEPSQRVAAELAALELPRGCALLVLSQPGAHVDPLISAGALTLSAPPLNDAELYELADKNGTTSLLPDRAPDSEEVRTFLSALREITSGNALYATYACRELQASSSSRLDPANTIRKLPPFDGTLEAYYAYLLSSIPDGFVADTLALLEFSLDRDSLRAIWPEFAGRVDAEVARLSPALNDNASQGGLRVYHESFARFLRTRRASDEAGTLLILRRVAGWLEANGLFDNSRSFRFLLALRERAGDHRAVVDCVDAAFLTRSVANGFMPEAILVNIGVAVRCAGRLLDWPALGRLVEMSRAASTFEYERLGETFVEFSDVVVAMIGGARFAERLLHDQKVTVPPRGGLELCAQLDRLGVVAPWSEYLEALRREQETSNTSYSARADQRIGIAQLRGVGRQKFPTPDAVPSGYDWALLARSLEVSLPPEGAVDAICDVIGSSACLAALKLVPNNGAYAIALAERGAKEGDTTTRDEAIKLALEAPPSGSLPRLFRLGVRVENLPSRVRDDLSNRFDSCARSVNRKQADVASVAEWIDLCALAARLEPELLRSIKNRFAGTGWYLCWLRFVGSVSEAEVVGGDATILATLSLLDRELDPFSGELPACRLYTIREQISSTIDRAIACLSDSTWSSGAELLVRVAHGLMSTAEGEPSGPIEPHDLLRMLVESTSGIRRSATEAAIDYSLVRTRGRYYSEVAGFHLLHSRCALRYDDDARARQSWERACEHVVAYGYRRDLTVFEVLDPIDALAGKDVQRTRQCLELLQATCLRVKRHTDGKDTRHVLSRWWALLALADPAAASAMSASELLLHCNDVWDVHERTRVALWRSHHQDVDPVVAAALRLSIETHLEEADASALGSLLVRVQRAPSSDLKLLLQASISRIDDRSTGHGVSNSAELLARDDLVVDSINEAIRTTGMSVARRASLDGREEPVASRSTRSPTEWIDALVQDQFDPGPFGIRQIARAARRLRYDAPLHESMRLANAFGYRLLGLLDAGHPGDAEVALYLLADAFRFNLEQPILVTIAEGLDAHGQPRLAAIAHVLAWTRTRGGGGFLTFGGEQQLDSLRRAVALDRDTALAALAREIEDVVAQSRGTMGVTQGLIYAFALVDLGATTIGDEQRSSTQTAFAIWDAAYQVIASRTPRVSEHDDPPKPYTRTAREARLDVEKALSLAVVSGLGHPSREQKRRTLIGVAVLLKVRGDVAMEAVTSALTQLSDPTTAVWLLRVLAAGAPPDILRAAVPTLEVLAVSEFLGVRSVAREILALLETSAPKLPGGTPVPRLLAPEYDEPGEIDVAYYIVGTRVDSVDELPGLLEAVSENADAASDKAMSRLGEQKKDLAVPNDRGMPDAVFANVENIETELQRVAGQARATLVANGSGFPDDKWERRLNQRLESPIKIAMAMERTREPRPKITPPPSTAIRAVTRTLSAAEASIVGAGPFSGFRVLASVEIRKRGPYEQGGPIVTGGAAKIGIETGRGPIPLGILDIGIWFSSSRGTVKPTRGGLVGTPSISGGDLGKMGLGWTSPVLIPHPWLLTVFGLRGHGSDLQLLDEAGIAITLRTWRAHYHVDDYRLAFPMLIGSQLIIRSDLFDRLTNICAGELFVQEFVKELSADTSFG